MAHSNEAEKPTQDPANQNNDGIDWDVPHDSTALDERPAGEQQRPPEVFPRLGRLAVLPPALPETEISRQAAGFAGAVAVRHIPPQLVPARPTLL